MAGVTAAFDFIDHLKSLSSVEDVLAALQAEAAKVGLDHFIATGLPMPNQPLLPLILLNSWPAGWLERYSQEDYFQHDGVAQWALRTTEPFTWREVPQPLMAPRKSQRVMNEATDFDMIDGFLVPMFSSRHWQAAVTFASSRRCDLPIQSRSEIHLISIYAVNRVRQILGDVPSVKRTLSPREAECLTWIAAGKNAEDVGDILGLSTHTVQTHLRNIRVKLDVATITQAVVEALRGGEIRI
ncbi:LuxR family transcriptional regulator [Aureimonas sp. Leaf324]|jgi:LuxR family quorum sensing-dependent transcriptional regulator|uniref:LuxR family transcriptional regulator n=1 Tax=Aureimonas sp. Leaf324 TaxID=1736336 RepID=UPI0006F1E8A3|nr:LuxR family transcriptional regulator [Aureimonas sp. Leaf324]KQQ85084.1 hypothetical protein ASF65_19910 [Aureimonas sp. Leaf324]